MAYRRRRTYGRRRHGGGLHDLIGFIVGAVAIVGVVAFVTGAPTSATERPVVVVSAPTATIIETADPTARPASARPSARVVVAPAATDDPALMQCLIDLGIDPDSIDLDSIDPAEYGC